MGMPNSEIDVYDVVRSGETLTVQEVEEMERQLEAHPDDVAARTRLLGYYFGKQYSDPTIRKALNQNILWLIENAPEAEVLSLPYGHLDKIMDGSAYEKGKALWIAHMESRKDNVRVHAHAANYCTQHDKDVACRCYTHLMELEPKNPKWPAQYGQLLMLDARHADPASAKTNAAMALEFLEAAYQLESLMGKDPLRKNLAEAALMAGEHATASKYAESMLNLPGVGWNSGNNIHYGNIILGHLAMEQNKVEEASSRLLLAGKTKGSPQLDSFGPNMTLAKALLDAGEKDSVLAYLEECRRFWKMDRGRLDTWSQAIKSGGNPFLKGSVKF